MKEQRHENCFSMPEDDLTMYGDEKTLAFISFPIYQAHTINPLVLCVDTGVRNSYIGNNALERISLHSGVILSNDRLQVLI